MPKKTLSSILALQLFLPFIVGIISAETAPAKFSVNTLGIIYYDQETVRTDGAGSYSGTFFGSRLDPSSCIRAGGGLKKANTKTILRLRHWLTDREKNGEVDFAAN